MVFCWLARRREIERLKEIMKNSFFIVRQDIDKIAKWIQFLDEKDEKIEMKVGNQISEVNLRLTKLEQEISELKDAVSFFSTRVSKRLSKQVQQLSKQPTGVGGVQTGVWTAVQTAFIENLTLTERAILWVLLNTDMKLSYKDIATVLGKDPSTIRGQINLIKQKSEGIIQEIIERNGKKRLYIPQEMKEKLFKNVKVRVREKGKRGQDKAKENMIRVKKPVKRPKRAKKG